MNKIRLRGVYLINFLCILILRCGNVIANQEPSELKKLLRENKVNGILMIKKSVLDFRKSYYIKKPSFILSKKNKFNKEIPFDKFDDAFKNFLLKDYVYAGLKYEVEDIQILSDVIMLLVKDNISFNYNTKEPAFILLKSLNDIGYYISEFISLILNPSFLYNMYNLHISNIAEIDKTIKSIFYLVDQLRLDIMFILKDLVRIADFSDQLDIATIIEKLSPITSKKGFIYEKIYSGNTSLKGLMKKLKKYL